MTENCNMKTKVLLLIVGMMASLAHGQSFVETNTVTATPDKAIPVGNPTGVSVQFNVTGSTGVVSDVQVNLDITGGFNGNLYAYLTGPQGQMAVLLNRVGVTGSNPFGYSDAGFNITLDANATSNIHDYGSTGYSTNSSGQVTGTWKADGRNINPLSSGSLFDSAPTTSGLNVFEDTAATGVWTLFVADLSSGGGQADLSSVGISVITVPEPGTWALLGGGLVLVAAWRRQRTTQG